MNKFSKLSEFGKPSKLSLIYLSCLIGLLVFLAAEAQSTNKNSTLSLQKDRSTGYFILNMRDSQGIKSFSLVFPTNKLPYGGDYAGCPQSKKLDNIAVINDTEDFTPLLNAVIVDCQGNETEFEIAAPDEKGVSKVKKVGIEPPQPPPPPPASSKSSESAAQSETPGKIEARDPLANIQYPVKELGSCENKDSCKAYCEAEAHLDRCLKFAEENGLLKHNEIERGKKFSEIIKTGGGPNGCKTEKECFLYCNDVDRIDECVAFAEKNGFMEAKELEEAKKIQSIVRAGKSLPGNCKNRAACEAFCKNPEHMDECIAFAKESGLMSPEEIAEAEKFLPLMKSGQTPGGCKSREECDAFCNAEGNFEECFAFADKAGLISDKEREIMKKTGGKGPGGCRGRTCQTFCENPANQDECFKFAKEYGLMSEEDLARMEEGKKMLREQLENGPPEIQECLKSVISVEKLESDGFAGGPELGEKMRECIETLIPEGARGQFEFGPGGEFHGPGGCKSREECETYCRANPEACGFGGGGSGGGLPTGGGSFSGPGGCQSREECEAYCKEHPSECQGFGGGGPGGGQGGVDEEHNGFTECGIVTGAVAVPVCGINGRGAPPGVETTYFNRCHAEQSGVQILHDGECKEEKCPGIADPVCGNDNINWTSPCAAEEHGGGVKHKGVCTKEDFGGQNGGGGFSGGPGGCQSPAECQAYCQAHPQECGSGSLPPPITTQACAPLPSGLVSWLDDDKSSNTTGSVPLAPGKVGNALKFDASGGYVKDENSEKLNFGTGPFSLEAWINWDGGGSVKGNIMRKSNYPVSGDGAGYWLVIGKEKSILEFFVGETVGNQGKARGSVSTPISSGVWHHVAATRNSAGTMSLYIDGRLKGTAEAANANTTSAAPFTLGAWDDRFGVIELFSGLIDDASAYNRALNESEIQAIFNAGSNGKCSSSSGGGGSSTDGPGGCQNVVECTTYCTAHYTDPACAAYAVPEPYIGGGGTPPTPPPTTTNFNGPGGCTTPETCREYCTKNYTDPACQQFIPTGSQAPLLSPFAAVLAPFLDLLFR